MKPEMNLGLARKAGPRITERGADILGPVSRASLYRIVNGSNAQAQVGDAKSDTRKKPPTGLWAGTLILVAYPENEE